MTTKPTTYDDWMRQVDGEIIRRTGVGAADLPDFLYADAFEEGATPAQAAREAIAYANEF